MKQYYTNEVHFTATVEELQMFRVALSCWLNKHQDWKKSIPENQEYYQKMLKLYKDDTKVLESLPF